MKNHKNWLCQENNELPSQCEQLRFEGFEDISEDISLDLPNTTDMLVFQSEMAKRFSYKPMPDIYSKECRKIYKETLPLWVNLPESSTKPLFTLSGTKISNGYERVVIGDYGAFIEIKPEDMQKDVLCIAKGQEYRYTSRYKDNVKYYWLTAKDDSNIKIYQQIRKVPYADYLPDMFYISPFELKPSNDKLL